MTSWTATTDDVASWVGEQVGCEVVVELAKVRPWAVVWQATDASGRSWWAKQNCPGQAFEAELVAVLARLAPPYVVPVVVADPERGLLMGRGASAFLTDVSFADFSLDVDVTAAAPSVVLREESGRELEVGGAGCAFAQGAERHVEVVRSGRRVVVRADDEPARACPTELAAGARVAIGLRGGAAGGLSGARNLLVVRE